MKRKVYILLFTILGILVQFLVHAGIEIWYIGKLVADFSKYGLGLSWNQWVMIHHITAVVLFVTGASIGYLQGRFWWRKIYEEGRLEKWEKLRHNR